MTYNYGYGRVFYYSDISSTLHITTIMNLSISQFEIMMELICENI